MNARDLSTIQDAMRNMDYLDKMLVNNVINPEPTESLLDFTTETYKQYEPNRFSAFVADKLDKVARGEIRRLIISAPPQHSKSFYTLYKQQYIFLADGSRKHFEDINIGDELVSTDIETLTQVSAKVKNKFYSGNKEVYKISFHSGRELYLADTHPLYTIDGWLETKDLKIGDKVAGYKHLKFDDTKSKPLPQGMASILGYMIGDGSFTEKSITFTNADDKIINHFQDCFKNFKLNITYDGKYHYRIVMDKESGCTESARSILKKYMDYGTAYFKKVPECIFTAPTSDKAEFLGAYFACDGAVILTNKSPSVEYYSMSKELLWGVQTLLSHFGIYSTFKRKPVKYKGEYRDSWYLIINGQDIIKFANNIKVVGVKNEKLQQAKSKLIQLKPTAYHESIPNGWHKHLSNPSMNWYRINHGLRAKTHNENGTQRNVVTKLLEADESKSSFLQAITNDTIYWDKITSIEYLGIDECYDIEVENTHNYVINNIITHNSELVSVRFPAFYLGKNPDAPIILASYGATLAEDKGRQVRTIVESPEYSKIFPKVTTNKESRAVALWHVQGHLGKVLSVGVGGPITGHGAMLGIIDDAVANFEDANSPTIRQKTWDWYRTTFRTRVWEKGSIVIIMTRWHSLDLIGQILNSSGSEDWEVYRVPAISESQAVRDKANFLYNLPPGLPDLLNRKEGEAAAPNRFSIQILEKIKRDVGSQGWNSLYQGAPFDVEGNRVKPEWLPIVPNLPPTTGKVYRVRAWDKAGSENAESDYTVGTLMAYYETENKYYIEDVVRFQHSVGTRDKLILETAEADAAKYENSVAIFHEQEPGSAGKDVAALINKMLAAFPVSSATATGSKEVRFEPFAKACERREVSIVQDTPEKRWNQILIDELTSFPTGSHDDIPDSVSYCYNQLATRKPKIIITSY